jgi:hypothetical protein
MTPLAGAGPGRAGRLHSGFLTQFFKFLRVSTSAVRVRVRVTPRGLPTTPWAGRTHWTVSDSDSETSRSCQ